MSVSSAMDMVREVPNAEESPEQASAPATPSSTAAPRLASRHRRKLSDTIPAPVIKPRKSSRKNAPGRKRLSIMDLTTAPSSQDSRPTLLVPPGSTTVGWEDIEQALEAGILTEQELKTIINRSPVLKHHPAFRNRSLAASTSAGELQPPITIRKEPSSKRLSQYKGKERERLVEGKSRRLSRIPPGLNSFLDLEPSQDEVVLENGADAVAQGEHGDIEEGGIHLVSEDGFGRSHTSISVAAASDEGEERMPRAIVPQSPQQSSRSLSGGSPSPLPNHQLRQPLPYRRSNNRLSQNRSSFYSAQRLSALSSGSYFTAPRSTRSSLRFSQSRGSLKSARSSARLSIASLYTVAASKYAVSDVDGEDGDDDWEDASEGSGWEGEEETKGEADAAVGSSDATAAVEAKEQDYRLLDGQEQSPAGAADVSGELLQADDSAHDIVSIHSLRSATSARAGTIPDAETASAVPTARSIPDHDDSQSLPAFEDGNESAGPSTADDELFADARDVVASPAAETIQLPNLASNAEAAEAAQTDEVQPSEGQMIAGLPQGALLGSVARRPSTADSERRRRQKMAQAQQTTSPTRSPREGKTPPEQRDPIDEAGRIISRTGSVSSVNRGGGHRRTSSLSSMLSVHKDRGRATFGLSGGGGSNAAIDRPVRAVLPPVPQPVVPPSPKSLFSSPTFSASSLESPRRGSSSVATSLDVKRLSSVPPERAGLRQTRDPLPDTPQSSGFSHDDARHRLQKIHMSNRDIAKANVPTPPVSPAIRAASPIPSGAVLDESAQMASSRAVSPELRSPAMSAMASTTSLHQKSPTIDSPRSKSPSDDWEVASIEHAQSIDHAFNFEFDLDEEEQAEEHRRANGVAVPAPSSDQRNGDTFKPVITIRNPAPWESGGDEDDRGAASGGGLRRLLGTERKQRLPPLPTVVRTKGLGIDELLSQNVGTIRKTLGSHLDSDVLGDGEGDVDDEYADAEDEVLSTDSVGPLRPGVYGSNGRTGSRRDVSAPVFQAIQEEVERQSASSDLAHQISTSAEATPRPNGYRSPPMVQGLSSPGSTSKTLPAVPPLPSAYAPTSPASSAMSPVPSVMSHMPDRSQTPASTMSRAAPRKSGGIMSSLGKRFKFSSNKGSAKSISEGVSFRAASEPRSYAEDDVPISPASTQYERPSATGPVGSYDNQSTHGSVAVGTDLASMSAMLSRYQDEEKQRWKAISSQHVSVGGGRR